VDQGRQTSRALDATILSSVPGQRSRLQLSVLAYNLGNLWRRLVLPARIDSWSFTSVQQRLVKTGGRLVRHARYYWLLLAESHLTRRLFGSMLQRIWALPVPTG
jgi:Transposase DDE domain group 1